MIGFLKKIIFSKAGIGIILASIIICTTLLFFPTKLFAQETDQYLNLVSLVRGKEKWVNTEKNWLELQLREVSKREFSGTWLFDADAIRDKNIVERVKNFNNNQEVGLLMEVTRNLADDLNLSYDQLASDHEPQNAFLSGYSLKDKNKIIDYLFKEFQQEFGYFPKSVGAWFIDSWSLGYMRDKYGIEAVLLVSEQYATDHHTIRGHVWQAPYYPSQHHSLIPAKDLEDKIDVVVIQWAAREPLRGYGFYREFSNFSVQANDYTQQRLDKKYFDKLAFSYLENTFNDINQLTVGIEVGQEGAEYFEEFTKQLEILSTKPNIKILSMSDFANTYKTFQSTNPILRISTWKGNETEGSWAAWITTSNYRAGLIADEKGLWMRDLRMYNDAQDDLSQFADKRSELIRQTEAIIDEVGLGTKWLLTSSIKNIEPRINKSKNEIEITFGEKVILFSQDEFSANFDTEPNPTNLNQQTKGEWRVFSPNNEQILNTPSNKGWQIVFLVVVIGAVILSRSFSISFLFPGILLSLASSYLLMNEVLVLTPLNDLGITYLLKVTREVRTEAIFSYAVVPILISTVGLYLFAIARTKTRSLWIALVIQAMFYFGAGLGWLFPLYRRLPLDPGLVTGIKSNALNFIWLVNFPSLEKLSYAFSAGQMHIDILESIIAGNQIGITILLPLALFIFVNIGFLLTGVLFLFYIWFQNKNYTKILALAFFILVSPFFVNQVDVRIPTFMDVLVKTVAVIGTLIFITNIKQNKYRYLFSLVLFISMLPGLISLINRNQKLSIRTNTNWYDRSTTIDTFTQESRMTDIYLWNIQNVNGSTIYLPMEIGEYYFLDLQEVKSGMKGIMENSYAFLGKVEENSD